LMSDALTYDLGGSSGTSEVGDTIAEILSSLLRKHFATV